MQRLGIITAAFILSVCIEGHAWAQPQSIQVPAAQRALSDLLSKYNDLDADAPNDIQRHKIETQFRQEFCARIPQGNVSGWIGSIGSINDRGPDKSIQLDMGVNVYGLRSGNLGIELSLANYYGYGVSQQNMQPHSSTSIPVGSSLYELVSNLRAGDVVRFNGTFVPYVSTQACYENDTSRFALVQFTSIQKIGWNIHLQ